MHQVVQKQHIVLGDKWRHANNNPMKSLFLSIKHSWAIFISQKRLVYFCRTHANNAADLIYSSSLAFAQHVAFPVFRSRCQLRFLLACYLVFYVQDIKKETKLATNDLHIRIKVLIFKLSLFQTYIPTCTHKKKVSAQIIPACYHKDPQRQNSVFIPLI